MKKSLIIQIGLSLLVMMLIAPPSAKAANPASVEVTVTLPAIFVLDLDRYSILFEPDLGDFLDTPYGVKCSRHGGTPDHNAAPYGWTENEPIWCTITSSAEDWGLFVSGEQPFFGYDTGWDKKPCGDIVWEDGPTSGYRHLEVPTNGFETYHQIDTGIGPTEDEDIDVTFRVLLNLADDLPGDYTYTVVITLTSAL